jgi:hypothetical protein
MNSPATSAARLRTHRSAIIAWLLFSLKAIFGCQKWPLPWYMDQRLILPIGVGTPRRLTVDVRPWPRTPFARKILAASRKFHRAADVPCTAAPCEQLQSCSTSGTLAPVIREVSPQTKKKWLACKPAISTPSRSIEFPEWLGSLMRVPPCPSDAALAMTAAKL